MPKILIAEDSTTDLEYIKGILEGMSYDYIVAMDGEEAQRLAKEERPDLILLDVVMPKKNGFQVCRELKQNEGCKDIPIIIVSSKSEDHDRFWGAKQGADAYITKPFEPMDLLLMIKKQLAER